ncbi:MAG: ABC transporter permease [Bacilli bacterium]|nr:ABC transporter permease [Bacilli bacterium]
MTEPRVHKERAPLFHVSKRANMPLWMSLCIRFGFIVAALLIGMLVLTAAYQANPFEAIGQLFVGTFSTPNRIFDLLRRTALLLGVSLALIPAFKMRFWNLGGNGQILVGVLVTVLLMYYLGGVIADWAIMLIMIPCAILAGMIWAVIPAIFKAFFGTNESLFTLMMNYIASKLVVLVISLVITNGSGIMPLQQHGRFPELINKYMLPVFVILAVLIFMVFYLRTFRHGYELSVVGESTNTARYVGINVKTTIIRTLCISGAICGLVGCLIGGAIDYTVSATSDQNLGFTAIMAVWLGKSNPLIVVGTSFFISFITKGMGTVQSYFGISNSATSDIVMGLVYFFIIACDFFIEYKISFVKKTPTIVASKPETKGERQ